MPEKNAAAVCMQCKHHQLRVYVKTYELFCKLDPLTPVAKNWGDVLCKDYGQKPELYERRPSFTVPTKCPYQLEHKLLEDR